MVKLLLLPFLFFLVAVTAGPEQPVATNTTSLQVAESKNVTTVTNYQDLLSQKDLTEIINYQKELIKRVDTEVVHFKDNIRGKLKPRKIALVCGRNDYSYFKKLKNSENDATDMAAVLKGMGYEVKLLLNSSSEELAEAVDVFGEQMKSSDIFFLYYSGHGGELDGIQYLCSKTANPSKPAELLSREFRLSSLNAKIANSKIRLGIVVIDACRSSPVRKDCSKDLVFEYGLTEIKDMPKGVFTALAASPNGPALESHKRNSRYTEAILKYIGLKDISIDELFDRVHADVQKQTNEEQIPMKQSTLDTEYYLHSANPYAITTINKRRFKQQEIIKLDVKLLNTEQFHKNTTLEVNIKQQDSTTNTITHWKNKYKLTSSQLICDPSLKPGRYEVNIDFYISPFPDKNRQIFYSKSFNIIVMQ